MTEADTRKKLRKVCHPIQLLTPEQARQFLRAVKNDPLEALSVLALTTGMRWGDLLTLKWTPIDLTRGRLQISEQKTNIQRCIVLTTLASEALTRHHHRQNEQRLAAGSAWKDHGLVFCNPTGHPPDVNSVRRHSFVQLREHADLPSLRFHDLRPNAIHFLLSAGAHPRVVQEIFGYRYSSTTVSVNISSSALLSLQEEVAERFNALLTDEQKQGSPITVQE